MGKFTCGLKYKAKRSVHEIEDWLDDNCSGDWDVQLEGIDDSDPAGIVNHFAILFERPEDRDLFRVSIKKI